MWNFAVKLNAKKLESRGYSVCGEGCVILSSTVFERLIHPSDGQTNGRWHIARYSIYAVAR